MVWGPLCPMGACRFLFPPRLDEYFVLILQGWMPGALQGQDHRPKAWGVGFPRAGVPGTGILGQRSQEQGPWSWNPSSGHPRRWNRRAGGGRGEARNQGGEGGDARSQVPGRGMPEEEIPEWGTRTGGAKGGDPRNGVPGAGKGLGSVAPLLPTRLGWESLGADGQTGALDRDPQYRWAWSVAECLSSRAGGAAAPARSDFV